MAVDTYGKSKGFRDDLNIVTEAISEALNKEIRSRARGNTIERLRDPNWKSCEIKFQPGRYPVVYLDFVFNGEGRRMMLCFKVPYEASCNFPDELAGEANTFSWNVSVWGAHEEIMSIANQAVKSVTRNPIFYLKSDCSDVENWDKVRKERAA